jgi:hypothetical protein
MRFGLASVVLTLLLTAPAYASDNGEGLAGETDDKVVTFVSFGVIGFFIAFVIVASAIQGMLDKRKEERKAAELRKRVGW